MKHVVFINCTHADFIDMIISGEKTVETRNRNTLKRFLGETVYLAETGKGKPVVRCTARITRITEVFTLKAYEEYKHYHAVPENSTFYWNDTTKKKVFYELADVKAVDPFVPEGIRHGRVYMDIDD